VIEKLVLIEKVIEVIHVIIHWWMCDR
jgi:hypothetical protein